MKQCSDCHKTLPFADFNPRLRNKDGYDIRCRSCRYLRYNKENPNNVLRIMYRSQCDHSVIRGHTPPAYTMAQLGQWIEAQPHAYDMWQAWIQSEYNTELKPSIDRLNNSQSYTLANIRLVTWQENKEAGHAAKRDGSVKTLHKGVTAYHLDGTTHRSYVSINEALREFNSSSGYGITTVANGTPVKDGRGRLYTPQTYKGFKWKWN